MALDLGSKTIGLAGGDLASRVASPGEVLARQGTKLDVQELCRRVVAEGVSVVVVGLPLELDGTAGRRARIVLRFVEALKQGLLDAEQGTVVETWDERFSTQAAQRSMLEGDLSRKRRKSRVDAVAAQMILSAWMDARAASFVPSEKTELHDT